MAPQSMQWPLCVVQQRYRSAPGSASMCPRHSSCGPLSLPRCPHLHPQCPQRAVSPSHIPPPPTLPIHNSRYPSPSVPLPRCSLLSPVPQKAAGAQHLVGGSLLPHLSPLQHHYPLCQGCPPRHHKHCTSLPSGYKDPTCGQASDALCIRTILMVALQLCSQPARSLFCAVVWVGIGEGAMSWLGFSGCRRGPALSAHHPALLPPAAVCPPYSPHPTSPSPLCPHTDGC